MKNSTQNPSTTVQTSSLNGQDVQACGQSKTKPKASSTKASATKAVDLPRARQMVDQELREFIRNEHLSTRRFIGDEHANTRKYCKGQTEQILRHVDSRNEETKQRIDEAAKRIREEADDNTALLFQEIKDLGGHGSVITSGILAILMFIVSILCTKDWVVKSILDQSGNLLRTETFWPYVFLVAFLAALAVFICAFVLLPASKKGGDEDEEEVNA